MIEEVVATEQVFKIDAADAAKLMQLVELVFEKEAGIESDTFDKLVTGLRAITERLRRQGARDPAAPEALRLDASTRDALAVHLTQDQNAHDKAGSDDIELLLGSVLPRRGAVGLSGCEYDTLRHIARSGALDGQPALADLNATLRA